MRSGWRMVLTAALMSTAAASFGLTASAAAHAARTADAARCRSRSDHAADAQPSLASARRGRGEEPHAQVQVTAHP